MCELSNESSPLITKWHGAISGPSAVTTNATVTVFRHVASRSFLQITASVLYLFYPEGEGRTVIRKSVNVYCSKWPQTTKVRRSSLWPPLKQHNFFFVTPHFCNESNLVLRHDSLADRSSKISSPSKYPDRSNFPPSLPLNEKRRVFHPR